MKCPQFSQTLRWINGKGELNQMEKDSSEEMRKWVAALSVSEKRFIKLLGKARSGNTDSQQLEYFDWLNQSEADAKIPKQAKFGANLPTVSNRLKDLILDGLRLLNKEANIDALLRTTLDEIAILREKRLHSAAARQLRRAKKAALQHSRYGFALQCIQIEQELAVANVAQDTEQILERLRAEEFDLLKAQSELSELRHMHSLLHARAAQLVAPRTSKDLESIVNFAGSDLVLRSCHSQAYLERTFACNIFAYKAWISGDVTPALPLLADLLQDWNDNPEWQVNQSGLLYFLCNFYQTIVFWSPISAEDAERYLRKMPDFKGLAPDIARDFQRLLLHNQFTFSLNTGQLDRLPSIIQDIDAWLKRNEGQIPEARVLPFLHNCLVAEFIMGDLATARKRVREIQNLPNRKVREDIRDFAQLLQAVLLFEMNDDGLDDYLLRAGKRHFKNSPRDVEFELLVLGFLDRCLDQPSSTTEAASQLAEHLAAYTQNRPEGSPPVVGLMEMRLWAKAKKLGKSLRDVFLEAVRENLASLS